MTAELYPNRLRATGASTATAANWPANLLITVTFLTAVDALGKDVVFWIYAAFAAVGIVFVRGFVPETNCRSLEEIEVCWTHGRSWPKSRHAGHPAGLGGARCAGLASIGTRSSQAGSQKPPGVKSSATHSSSTPASFRRSRTV